MASFLGHKNHNTMVHVELDTVPHPQPLWATATKLAVDDRGIAALLVNAWGKGTVVTATAAVDKSLGPRDLSAWYSAALQLCVRQTR